MIQTIIMVIGILALFAIFIGFVYTIVSLIKTLIKKDYKKRNRKLTPEEVIQFCDETITRITYETNLINRKYLCGYLRMFLIYNIQIPVNILDNNKNLQNNNKNLQKYLPEFTNENAVKYCNGYAAGVDSTWWDGFYDINGYDEENRILFLQWIKAQYVTPKE